MKIIWSAMEQSLIKPDGTRPGGVALPRLYLKTGEPSTVLLQMVFEHQGNIYCAVLDAVRGQPYINKYPITTADALFALDITKRIFPENFINPTDEEYNEIEKALAERGDLANAENLRDLTKGS